MLRKLSGDKGQHWLALLILIGATLVVTWPIAARLGTHIPGSEGDAWEHFWIFQWVKDALFSGSDLFYTDLIFYPQGTSLATHNFAWINIGVWLPLQAIFGNGAAYSLMMLMIFVVNGFAVYLFVYGLIGRFTAGMAAGLAAAFWPHILSHHDHPNLIVTCWVTFTLLCFYRLLETGRRRYAVLSGIFLALVGMTRWQTLVLGGGVIGLYFLYQLAANRTTLRTKEIVRWLGLIGGIALLLMLPLFLAQFTQAAALGETISSVADGNAGQSDLLAYFLPSRFHPWWGQAAFDQFYGPLQTSKVFVPFLGYTTLILAGLGAIWRWRQTRFWLGLALLYMFLALGPTLLVNGRSILPLPYQLLESTLLGALIRSPDRFNIFLSLPVAVMVGYGIQAVLEQPRLKQSWGQIIIILALLFILIEYAVRYPTLALNDFPTWYYTLAQEPNEFAILELPMSDRIYDEVYMYYQFLHGKPLVGGSVARPPEETFAFINSLSMLGGVPEQQVPLEDVINVGSNFSTLAQANVKYLIFHKKFMGADQLQQWRDWLFVSSYYEDEALLVYETDWIIGESLPFNPITDTGLGIISADIQPTSTTQDGWVEVVIQWGAQAPLSEAYDVCFELEDSAGVAVDETCVPVSTKWPTNLWPANEMVTSQYLLHFSPYLASDRYTIQARIGDAADDSEVIIGSVDFSANSRVFSDEMGERPLADWDNKIGLMDFNIYQSDAFTLALDVKWLAQQRMDESYKAFVHIIDADTQTLVSQSDAVPRDWRYPTNWWEQGELITDTLSFQLPTMPTSQEYEVWLGFYSLGTNNPLLVTNSDANFLAVENQIQLARLVLNNQGLIE